MMNGKMIVRDIDEDFQKEETMTQMMTIQAMMNKQSNKWRKALLALETETKLKESDLFLFWPLITKCDAN